MSLTYVLLNVICFILFSVIMAETEIASFLETSDTVKDKGIDPKYGSSRSKRPLLALEGDAVHVDTSDFELEKEEPVRMVRFKKEVVTVDPTLMRLKCALSKILTRLKSEDKWKRDTGKAKKTENRIEKKRQNDPVWGKWTNWAPCSVTCGKGRKIRWRNCVKNCNIETEMEEKRCQLPACPNKLFGIFKL